jgi:REP element-mobilizing transposase RayT
VVSRFARDEWWLDREGARSAYLACLARALQGCDAELLAYCLMSNHVHLVVVQGEARLERLMKSVHTGFASWAQRSRRREKTRGPVFAGRPRSVLVDKDAYLLELVRYVHNNPVRAKVVRAARNSAWSSHQAYVGRVQAPDWLRTGYVLERLGGNAAAARRAFDELVDAGRGEPRRPELSGAVGVGEAAAVRRELGDGHRVSDGVLGSESFAARVRKDVERVQLALSGRGSERRAGALGRPSVREVVDAVLELVELDPIELEEHPRTQRCAHAKRLAIWVWVHEYAGQQIEVARCLGLDTGVVSRYYGQAMAAAGEFDEQASAVTALLRPRRRARSRSVTKASAGAQSVRYHVDIDEA